MHVNVADGCCRSCSGQLQIIAADEQSLTVECAECAAVYETEADTFDGSIQYYSGFHAGREVPDGSRCAAARARSA